MVINIIITLVCIVLLVLFVSDRLSIKRRPRVEILKDIKRFVDGRMEEIEGSPNSYRIYFMYEGKNFIYEDTEAQGFNDKIFKISLKVDTKSPLTVHFTEKERKRIIENKLFLASELMDQPEKRVLKVKLPKELSELTIFTNNPTAATKFLNQFKVKRIFYEFKNIDFRGRPVVSLRIIDGTVILEFHTSENLHPRALEIQQDLNELDKYLNKMMVVVRELETLDELEEPKLVP